MSKEKENRPVIWTITERHMKSSVRQLKTREKYTTADGRLSNGGFQHE